MVTSKHSTKGTAQDVLDRLAKEEQRSRIRIEVAADPGQKEHAKKKNQQIRNLIRRIKKAAAGGIETADRWDLIDGEAPEDARSVQP